MKGGLEPHQIKTCGEGTLQKKFKKTPGYKCVYRGSERGFQYEDFSGNCPTKYEGKLLTEYKEELKNLEAEIEKQKKKEQSERHKKDDKQMVKQIDINTAQDIENFWKEYTLPKLTIEKKKLENKKIKIENIFNTYAEKFPTCIYGEHKLLEPGKGQGPNLEPLDL